MRAHPNIIDAALRRIERGSLRFRPASRLAPPEPQPAPPPPQAPAPPPPAADAGTLALLLAEDAALKIDQLCYVWQVVAELEAFALPGEPSLRRRAAELFLLAGGGRVEVPIEGPLRAVRSFLAAHRMEEPYVARLCEWYLNR